MEKKDNVDIVMVYQENEEENPHAGGLRRYPKDSKNNSSKFNENEDLPETGLRKQSSKTELKESGQANKQKKSSLFNMFPALETPSYVPEEQQYEEGDEDDPDIVVVYENQNEENKEKEEDKPNRLERQQQDRPPHEDGRDNRRRKTGRAPLGNLFMIAQEDPVPENSLKLQARHSVPKQPTAEDNVMVLTTAKPQQVKKATRSIGILLLTIIFFFLIIYGLTTEYKIIDTTTYPVNTTTQPIYAASLIFTSMFAIVGFGMIFMYFKKMTQSALFTSIFIVSFSLLFSPMVQKFWYNVFVHGFNSSLNDNIGPDYFVNHTLGRQFIYYDFYTLKLALISAISQLVVLLAVYGRLSGIQLVAFSLIFNFGWPLNHYALMYLQGKSPDGRFFDDYQISSIYLFGACAGIFTLIFTKKPPAVEQFQHSNYSAIFACFGAFFLYFTFAGTTILFTLKDDKPGSPNNHIWMQAVLNSFFALSSNVLMTFTFSILFEGKFVVRWSIFGLIMGGVIFGSVAELTGQIGAAIACGSGSGLLTVIYYSKIYPMINRETVSDMMGLILMLTISLLATVVVVPVLLVAYFKTGITLQPLANGSNNPTTVSSLAIVGWSLVYPAITVLIGCGVGLILSFVLRLFIEIDADKAMTDKLFFKSTHGLRVQKIVKRKKKKKQYNPKDYQNIKKVSFVQTNGPQSQIESSQIPKA